MKDANRDYATIIKEKEAIFRKMAFLEPIASFINTVITIDPFINAMSSFITEKGIEKALLKQFVQKALGLDKLNFKAIHLFWS
jgi:hypothetical protein